MAFVKGAQIAVMALKLVSLSTQRAGMRLIRRQSPQVRHRLWRRLPLTPVRSSLALVFLAVATGACGAESRAGDARKLVDVVVEGIRANYSHIQTLELTVEETVLNSVADDQVLHLEPANKSGTLTLTFPKRATANWRLFIDGDRIRCDTADSTSGGSLSDILMFADGVWTQFKPPMKTAWRRRPDQMGGVPLIDIRDLAAPSFTEPLFSMLQTCVIETAALVELGGNSTIEVVTSGPSGRFKWSFDSRRAHLPVRRESRYPDDSICDYCQLTYQSVLEGAAWIPARFDRMSFSPGVTATPSEEKWRQKHTILVKEIVKVNKPIAENTFLLSFPGGTTVKDTAGDNITIVRVGRDVEGGLPHSGRRISPLFAVNVIAIAVACIVLIVRRRKVRLRTSKVESPS